GAPAGTKTPLAQDSSGNSVSIAGAVGVNVSSNVTNATVGNNLSITASGPLTLSSANTTGATASADGSATGAASIGVGIAVGLNLVNATNTASLGTGDSVKSKGLVLSAVMAGTGAPTDSFGASAKS